MEREYTSYTSLDLLGWFEDGSLSLSPKFQRRSVWTPAARSYFIDTLIHGFPVPPLHIRVLTPPESTKSRREVIDGQQRLRALFDYMAGDYSLSKSLAGSWAGDLYKSLPPPARDKIRRASFSIYLYQDIPDEEVLEIFARLNTYSLRLNNQELRNGRYFGHFKQLCYRLAYQSLAAWTGLRVFTDSAIARMREVELVSELVVLMLDGLQDKKKTLNVFYELLDESWTLSSAEWEAALNRQPREWLEKEEVSERFKVIMDSVIEHLGRTVHRSPFRRPALFYTLFGAIYHRRYGLPGLSGLPTPQSRLGPQEWERLRGAIDELGVAFSSDEDAREGASRRAQRFAEVSARQTDNLQPRRARLESLWKEARLGE